MNTGWRCPIHCEEAEGGGRPTPKGTENIGTSFPSRQAGERPNEHRTSGVASVLAVFQYRPSRSHPSGHNGSYDACSFASCQCAVLGKSRGLASAATAAAVQFLWRLWRLSPMGLLGLSPTRKARSPPLQGTDRYAETAAPHSLPPSSPHTPQASNTQDRAK